VNVRQDTTPVIDQKQIESLVSSKIQEHELTKKQQENFNIVRSKLTERFGSNYQSVLREQSESLGLTDNDVNDLARKSPRAFFKTMGLDREETRESFQSPPRSSQRSDNFAPSTQKRTWSYYQKMRKENPEAYTSPKIQAQMHRDYVDQGRDFEDGDFRT
jgi:hypothetical protein